MNMVKCCKCNCVYTDSIDYNWTSYGYVCCKCKKSFEDTCKEKKIEKVNHPSHYQGKKFEVIDIIDDFSLGFELGNCIKYILRSGKKQDKIQDLNKAMWYLKREIDKGVTGNE